MKRRSTGSNELTKNLKGEWLRSRSLWGSNWLIRMYVWFRLHFRVLALCSDTVEPRFYELPPYNEVLGITNDIPRSSDSKTCGKEPLYNETSLQRTYFASPLALHHIEVPLYYINNSLHLARKYARLFDRGHYLFREANSFPRAKLEENWRGYWVTWRV